MGLIKKKGESIKSGKLIDIEGDKSENEKRETYQNNIPKNLKYYNFFKPENNYFDRHIIYKNLYENLNDDILQFNHELNELKKSIKKMDEELIDNIKAIINDKYPGINL